MGSRQPMQDESEGLRRRAEAALGKMIAKTVPSLASENVEALVHELRVHQIELQMQCEELRRTRQEIEDSRDRYCDLYESAPAAYITLDRLEGQSLRLIVTDITERKQAEDRLKRQDAELREQRSDLEALNTRLLAIEEDVRQSIARDLQEEFSQRIAAIMWQLATVEQREGFDQRVMYKLQEIKRHLSHLSVDLHHLAHRLYSRFLEHCDLDEAMKEYIDELNTYARSKVVYQLGKVPAECRPAQAVVLFRVLQEALANVAKHADATSVTVTLHAVDAELVLKIRDTGKGYDPGHRGSAPAGFGVIIMRERLRAVGGRLSIESTAGSGTTVRASVPLTATAE
jgi:signal transduction histidine kinase